jgi:hypothetical protein
MKLIGLGRLGAAGAEDRITDGVSAVISVRDSSPRGCEEGGHWQAVTFVAGVAA